MKRTGTESRKIFNFQKNVTMDLLASIITDIKHNKKRKKQLFEIKILNIFPQK